MNIALNFLAKICAKEGGNFNLSVLFLSILKPKKFLRLLLIGMALMTCGMSAQAAATCTGSMPNAVFYITSNTAVARSALAPTSYLCNGLTTSAFYAACTTSDVTTSMGSGGGTMPNRLAKSPSGSTLQFQLSNPNTGAAYAAGARLANIYSASRSSQSMSEENGFAITMAAQTLAPGDYSTVIPITIQIYSGTVWSCASTLQSSFTVNIAITFRVGTSCDISGVTGGDLGLITTSSGNNLNAITPNSMVVGGFSVLYTCSPGLMYNINISEGLNSMGGTADNRRQMSNTTSGVTSYINYTIGIVNNGTTFPIGGINLTAPAAGGGYIRPAANPGSSSVGKSAFVVGMPAQTVANLVPGIYADTLVVILTW